MEGDAANLARVPGVSHAGIAFLQSLEKPLTEEGWDIRSPAYAQYHRDPSDAASSSCIHRPPESIGETPFAPSSGGLRFGRCGDFPLGTKACLLLGHPYPGPVAEKRASSGRLSRQLYLV